MLIMNYQFVCVLYVCMFWGIFIFVYVQYYRNRNQTRFTFSVLCFYQNLAHPQLLQQYPSNQKALWCALRSNTVLLCSWHVLYYKANLRTSVYLGSFHISYLNRFRNIRLVTDLIFGILSVWRELETRLLNISRCFNLFLFMNWIFLCFSSRWLCIILKCPAL